MDLLQLSQFRVLARVQHMTHAAEELYIAQPSLSKAIKRLEEELGVPLFDRPGRQIRLNRFGAAFLERVEQAFLALEEGQRQMRDMAQPGQGEVALAAAALHWLPDPLRAFLAEHPATRFRLFQRPPPEMQRQLEAGEIDFGFASGPIGAPDIRWRHLLTEEVYLAVPRGHRFDGRDSVPLGEVAPESVVIGRRGDVLRDLMDGACRQAGFAPEVVCEADEPAAVHDFVAAGLGVAFIPALMRQQRGEQGLEWVHITDPVCHLTLGIAWHEAHHLSGATRAFRDFIIGYFAASGQKMPAPASDKKD